VINVSSEEQKQALNEFKKEDKENYNKMLEDTTRLLNMNVKGLSIKDKLNYTIANLYAAAGQEELAKEVMQKIPKSSMEKLNEISSIQEIPGLQKHNNKSTKIHSIPSQHGKKLPLGSKFT